MKNPTHVIKKPMVTEKGTFQSGEFNRHAFLVDKRATKDQIKLAIEELYSVRVESIATQNRKGKRNRTRFGYIIVPTTKKAIVKVHKDDTIELF